jgi:hypothetical protein
MDAKEMPTYADLVRWDDVRLIRWQAAARADLAANPAQPQLKRLYDAATVEVANRQVAWNRETRA